MLQRRGEGTGCQTVPHGVWPPGFRKPVPVKSNMGADQCVLFFELRPEVKSDLQTVPVIGNGACAGGSQRKMAFVLGCKMASG